MNAGAKTGIFAGVAIVLVLAAFLTAPGSGRTGRFDEEGRLFFPNFTDPGQAYSLSVVQVDAESVSGKRFEVQRKGSDWTIPSHYDYPADAKERMKQAAGVLIGLTKGAIRSDSRAAHAELGVLDPLATGVDVEGRGRKLVFKDEGGNVLAQLIVGKEVEGRKGMRFVRLPDSRRTYLAKIDTDLSIRFADWVETDLLGLDSGSVEKLIFDNYSVDEEKGMIRPGEKVVARKEAGGWVLEDMKEGEEVEEYVLDAAARRLSELKIVGVRPKPEGLTEKLGMARGIERQILHQQLAGRGYFMDSTGRLRSNEGDLFILTMDGVVYTLMFGEIVYGTGESVTRGGEEEKKEEEKEAGDPNGDGEKKSSSNRYLMVMVAFDESFHEKPGGEPLSEDEAETRRTAMLDIRRVVGSVDAWKIEKETFPETLAEALGEDEAFLKDPWDNELVYVKSEDGTFVVTSLGADGKEGGEGAAADISSDRLEEEEALLGLAKRIEEWEKKVKEGREQAGKLAKRFGPWYYVIDAPSFEEIRPPRDSLVKKKETEEDGNGGDDGDGDK